MTGRTVILPSASAAPCQTASHTSSPACIQIPLFPAAALAGPRHVYRILITTTWLALTLAPRHSPAPWPDYHAAAAPCSTWLSAARSRYFWP
jgi:hypothetical protein